MSEKSTAASDGLAGGQLEDQSAKSKAGTKSCQEEKRGEGKWRTGF